MLNYTISRREVEYQNLKGFTEKIHQEIVNIVSTLEWSIKSIKANTGNSLVCPYDSSHRISRKTLDRHLELCQWRKEGYNEYSIPLSESSLSSNSPSSIKLDSSLQNTILQEASKKDSTMKIGPSERLIPQTSDRIFTDFTCDERKALYDYVVSHTMKIDIGHDITDTHKPKGQDKDEKKLSFLELLMQERNLKRRRAKHKGVHTNKKSHTEILREVINQQMEVYIDYMAETQVVGCGTKFDTVTELGNSNRNMTGNITHNLPLQLTEIPSKRHSLLLEDSQQNYRESSTFRYDEQKYEHFEKSTSSYDRSLDKRDKYSRISSESWKMQKSRKYKRSSSRERDHDRRNKHSSTRQDHKRHSEKYYEIEKSSNSNKYPKRKKDHRENRERLEL
ncbi:U11/U12 small nuclear ribonucleoprotein 48 kDa protein-like [Osmia bicornis bicornis]|uniref:U11/U12 small nuclear ribonucleoprotein 48 kDa protein-like n=1 Tax=Osmia bicornis bicornis TaxID=1437191 RepID=UPI0010F7C31B|nr:U11/U12 small nuclear ribonucleoprotein 48 kDa protein-like [Osmia bicornis bicornis]